MAETGPLSHRTVHVRIEGRVQGVGFRAWTEDRARALGLKGWVRNRRDGWVEAVFSGQPVTVEEMLEACRAAAPGQVTAVVVLSEDGEAPTAFEVRASA